VTSFISEAQAEGLRHAVSTFERERARRLRWTSYRGLNPTQVAALIEQAGVAVLHDQIISVGPDSDAVRADFERRAAENVESLARAERTQARGAGSLPGQMAYTKAMEAARRIPAYQELQESYREVLARAWPATEELRAGVATVAGEVLAAIRQRAAAAAFEKLLPTRQAAEVVLGILDRFTETSRAFDLAAGVDLAVAGFDPANVEALRRLASLEFIRIAEKEKSCPSIS
jgi:hypothetical protein